ncbi:Coactosin-like protein [Plecturocebus cupreus]
MPVILTFGRPRWADHLRPRLAVATTTRRGGSRPAAPGCVPAAASASRRWPPRWTEYNPVHDNGSAVIWVTFEYDGSTSVPGRQRKEYQHFIQRCTDVDQLFAFVRFTTWHAMSKRSKFALIIWLGESISGLQRARTGTDKPLVKEVVQNCAKEFVISNRKKLEEDLFHQQRAEEGGRSKL